jgi:NADPH:quinone reductase-like Zn-dependent oxidoreductase
MLFHYSFYPSILTRFQDMNRLIAAADIKPIIDRVFAFEEVKEAYKYLASQNHTGKVVIQVTKT